MADAVELVTSEVSVDGIAQRMSRAAGQLFNLLEQSFDAAPETTGLYRAEMTATASGCGFAGGGRVRLMERLVFPFSRLMIMTFTS